MPKTLYLIDGHSQIYRAYYAPMQGNLSAASGEPTKATYVFMQQLLKLLARQHVDYVAMAMDGPTELLQRRQAYSEYKVTRKPMPEDLPPQIDRIRELVEALGVPVLTSPGHEADDIIATLADRHAGSDLDVVIVSGDKDLDQLIGEHVALYDPIKGQTLDAETLLAKKGYTPQQAVDVQSLIGDTSDNIPGVPGVGPKTAVKLIAKYGSAEAVIDAADQQTPKLSENLKAHRFTVRQARDLIALKRDVPVDVDLEAMSASDIHPGALREPFAELGFSRLMNPLEDLAAQTGGEGANPTPPEGQDPGAEGNSAGDPPPPPAPAETDYRCVNTPEALAELCRQLRGVDRLAVDTETTAREPGRATQPMWAEMVGICLAFKPRAGVYVPVRGPLGAEVLSVEQVREALGPVLADPAVTKIAHHAKFDRLVLGRAGMELAGPVFDTMLAAYVLDASRPSFKLDNLVKQDLGEDCIPIEDLIGKGKNQTTMDRVQLEAMTCYSAQDADVTLRLANHLEPQLKASGLEALFAELEMPLSPVLGDMERIGVRVEPAALKKLELALSNEADVLRDRIVALAGRPFNPDSPKQLAVVLFEDLQLPVIKKKKTGPSTDVSVLEELAAEHELPAAVLEYRKLTKLLGTYLKGLAACIHPQTGRVHTSFHQTGTVTGRLSSSDPNLQNIPIRTEQGRLIRSAFVADPGCVLLSADYSQVELRVLAHFCEDPTLLAAFAADRDIHRTVAAEVFGVAAEEVTAEQRAKAKTVNFGIVYGQTAYGLSRSLRIGRGEAQEFIVGYHKRFPQIRDFLASCVEQAKAQGYVETILGRRRPIDGLDSRNPTQRSAAERLAINSVVQGSAADLIKKAMLAIAGRIASQQRPSKMLLQIHDELVFEVPEGDLPAEREMILAEMTGAFDLKVPLKVDTGVGSNWMKAK